MSVRMLMLEVCTKNPTTMYKIDVHVLLPDLRLPCECCCLRSRREMRLLNMWSSFSSVNFVFSFFQDRNWLLLLLPFFSSSYPSSSSTTLFTLSRADNSKKPNESHILWNSGNDIPPVRPLFRNIKLQIKKYQLRISQKSKITKPKISRNQKKSCLFFTLFVVPVPTVLLLPAAGRRPLARQCVARFQFPSKTFRHVFAIDFFVGCHCFEWGFQVRERR